MYIKGGGLCVQIIPYLCQLNYHLCKAGNYPKAPDL